MTTAREQALETALRKSLAASKAAVITIDTRKAGQELDDAGKEAELALMFGADHVPTDVGECSIPRLQGMALRAYQDIGSVVVDAEPEITRDDDDPTMFWARAWVRVQAYVSDEDLDDA